MNRTLLKACVAAAGFVACGGIATFAAVLVSLLFHGTAAVIALVAVGGTFAIALGALADRVTTWAGRRRAAMQAARTAGDFRDSIAAGLTESFDDFSHRLTEADTTGGTE